MMPSIVTSSSPFNQQNETSYLIYIVGNYLGMDWGCDNSGAYTENAIDVFNNQFNFNYTHSGVYKRLSINDAEPIVKSNIESGKPVIMDGFRVKETYYTGWWIFKKKHIRYKHGHTWVCDGYRSILF